MSEIEDLEYEFKASSRLTRITINRKNKNRINNGIKERHCNKCLQWKPLDDFYEIRAKFQINPRAEIRYQARCKPCIRYSFNHKSQRSKK